MTPPSLADRLLVLSDRLTRWLRRRRVRLAERWGRNGYRSGLPPRRTAARIWPDPENRDLHGAYVRGWYDEERRSDWSRQS